MRLPGFSGTGPWALERDDVRCFGKRGTGRGASIWEVEREHRDFETPWGVYTCDRVCVCSLEAVLTGSAALSTGCRPDKASVRGKGDGK